MAEAIFRSLTNNLPSSSSPPHPLISTIDSAGTGAYHTLEPPDPRTIATLHAHNINGYTHGARKITLQDFDEFDYILAMDKQNLRYLQQLKRRIESRKGGTEGTKAEVRLFGEFGGEVKGGGKMAAAGLVGEEVVDPYYGADNGFEVVYEQVERFSAAFLREVVENNREGKGQRKEGNEIDGEGS